MSKTPSNGSPRRHLCDVIRCSICTSLVNILRARVCNQSARARSTPLDRVDRLNVGPTKHSDRSDRLSYGAGSEPTGCSFTFQVSGDRVRETGNCADQQYTARFPSHPNSKEPDIERGPGRRGIMKIRPIRPTF